MSLLANVNQPNPAGYYFALDKTPGTDVVTAQAFVATGGNEVGPVGMFTAKGDGLPAGTTMINLTTSRDALQWAFGLDQIATGVGNTGNNLALYAYDDSGNYLSTPMYINRSTGAVTFDYGIGTVDMAILGDLSVSGEITTGGVTVQKSQTDFAVQRSAVLPAVLPAGVSTYNLGAVFQLPATGLYMVDGALSFNASLGADTFVCAAGDFISIQLQPQPVAPGVPSGGVDIDVSPVPASATQTDRAWSNTVIDKLTGAYNYQAIAIVHNFSGTMAATGGATLLAGVDIGALCS